MLVRAVPVRQLVNELSASVPGTSIASIGLALALYTYEIHRMSSLRNVEAGEITAIIPALISLGALVGIALVYHQRPFFRLHRHPWTGFSIAGALTLTIFLLSGAAVPLSPAVWLLLRTIQRIGELYLLLCWAEVLTMLPGRAFAVLVALSLLFLGLFNGLSGLFKQNAVLMLIALVPLLSAACLYWFKDKRASFDADPAPLGAAGPAGAFDTSLWPSGTGAGTQRSAVLLFLAPLVGYPFVFGHIHYAWLPSQDGDSVSLAIQLGAAAGTAAAGAALLLLIAYFWGRRKIDLYNLLILPPLGIALYLTSLLHEQWVFLYVIPLNVCQKMVLFLAMLTPYLVPAKRSPLCTWCAAFALYTFGKMLSTSVSSELDNTLYALFVIVFILVLATSSVAGVVLDDNALSREGRSAGGADRAPEETNSPGGAPSVENGELAVICDALARDYRLTRREGEILRLLAEGMTASAIAETLVVSTSTAKTHMRNIYLKLDVHTHSELLLLVHRTATRS